MRKSAKDKLAAIFGDRRILFVAPLLALLLSLPSLMNGLCMDDYQQRTTLLTNPDGNPFEFYRMGTPQTEAMMQSGILPWWTHPESKLVFFRPIAKLLMQLDYRFWPDNFLLMHLHSSLWYLLLVAAIGLSYRQLIAVPIALGFAVMMFTFDGWHGGAVAWLANRNVIVAMVGSMFTLLCYQQKKWQWHILGWILFALTLACAEAALAIVGYLFAYEVFLSRRHWWMRMLRLLPYALIAIAWLAFWRRNGYGSAGPGFYTDPGADPGAFLRVLIYRVPAYLLGQFTFAPIEIIDLIEDARIHFYLVSFVFVACALLVKIFWPLLRSSAHARFFALGMLIATIPLCGSQLAGRSLWYVSFGAYGLLALWLESFFVRHSQKKLSALAVAMLILHLAISPFLFVFGSKVFSMLDSYMDTRTVRLFNSENKGRYVLAFSAQQFESNTYYPLLKDEALSLGREPLRSAQAVAKLRLLTSGADDFELLRESENMLVARCENGFNKMRKGKYGFNAGDSVVLDDMIVTVRAVNARREATEIEYRFNAGELQRYEVVAWGGEYFHSAALPAIGETISIKAKPVAS